MANAKGFELCFSSLCPMSSCSFLLVRHEASARVHSSYADLVKPEPVVQQVKHGSELSWQSLSKDLQHVEIVALASLGHLFILPQGKKVE